MSWKKISCLSLILLAMTGLSACSHEHTTHHHSGIRVSVAKSKKLKNYKTYSNTKYQRLCRYYNADQKSYDQLVTIYKSYIKKFRQRPKAHVKEIRKRFRHSENTNGKVSVGQKAPNYFSYGDDRVSQLYSNAHADDEAIMYLQMKGKPTDNEGYQLNKYADKSNSTISKLHALSKEFSQLCWEINDKY